MHSQSNSFNFNKWFGAYSSVVFVTALCFMQISQFYFTDVFLKSVCNSSCVVKTKHHLKKQWTVLCWICFFGAQLYFVFASRFFFGSLFNRQYRHCHWQHVTKQGSSVESIYKVEVCHTTTTVPLSHPLIYSCSLFLLASVHCCLLSSPLLLIYCLLL